jgi:hypothetical protein
MVGLAKRLAFAAGAAGVLMLTAAPAQAQLFYAEPTFERGPIEPGDPLIGIALTGANAAEQRAGLIWNLRAGLNVAALRCQSFRYLRAVDIYNAVLAHHSAELASAYSTLESYFRRRAGGNARAGRNALDEWNTSTYNDYSTQNSIGFCQTASNIGKEALARPKGEFLAAARERMRELRASAAVRYVDRIYPPITTLRPLPAALFAAPTCAGLTGRPLQQCQAGQTPVPAR